MLESVRLIKGGCCCYEPRVAPSIAESPGLLRRRLLTGYYGSCSTLLRAIETDAVER
jgi:hypothetical protein